MSSGGTGQGCLRAAVRRPIGDDVAAAEAELEQTPKLKLNRLLFSLDRLWRISTE